MQFKKEKKKKKKCAQSHKSEYQTFDYTVRSCT